MQRVAIIGSSGAGKSTLARKLGLATGLPVVHLDALSWLPGWKERDKAEFDELVRKTVAGESWIIDGNYSRTMEPRLHAADTIIWLDYPRRLCMWRALKRRVMYHNRSRSDIGEGCPEKIDLEFLAWIWNYPTRSRQKTVERLRQHAEGKTVHVFTRPKQADVWLAGI